MAKHKCSGCPHWVWHHKDALYGYPGFHQCNEPDYCERFGKMRIKRDSSGFITDDCLAEMTRLLPIEVFVGFEIEPHRAINTSKELEDYLFSALPYVLTTYYRKKEDEK